MSTITRAAIRSTRSSNILKSSSSSSMAGDHSSKAALRLASVSRHLSSSSRRMDGGKSETSPQSSVGASSEDDKVLYESNLSARIFKLNRPKALNSLDSDMILSLRDKTAAWRDSDLCKVILGTGNERAFCAGGDVKRLVQGRTEGVVRKDGKDEALEFFKNEFELNWSLARLGKPYVVVMTGITMGGGAGLALPAPIRIATPTTVFAMPETKIGYSPDVGAQYYLAQLDGNIGAWLAITGQEVYGRAVYDLGIATHYVSPTSINDIIFQISQLQSPTAFEISKIVASYTIPPSSGLNSAQSRESPTPITGSIREFLDSTFGKRSIPEIFERLERAATDEQLSEEVKAWAKIQKEMMELRSPTGMAVALEAFKRARKSMRLDEVLKDDMTMATAFCGPEPSTKDFETGVTAVLMDKSKSRPNWNPSTHDHPDFPKPTRISETFFSSSSSQTPTLNFQPKPRSRSAEPDSTWGKFRSFGLPSEMGVRSVVEGSAPGSGAFKVRQDEVLEGLGWDGVRGEMKVKVKEMLERYCTVDKDGYLSWNKRK